MSHNPSQRNSGSFEGRFDYRSLLPSSARNLLPTAANDENVEPEEESWLDSVCVDLSFRERMLGFGTCMVCGYMLSFGSFWRIRDLLLGNPYPLVLHTIVGNLLAWMGSFFLVGPKAQWRRLWEEKRKLASQAYMAALVLMILVIMIPIPDFLEVILLFLLMFIQYVAMGWYCLSYVPFGQETVQNVARNYLLSDRGGAGLS